MPAGTGWAPARAGRPGTAPPRCHLQRLQDGMPALPLKLPAVAKLAAGPIELILIDHPQRLPRSLHHIQLVIDVAQYLAFKQGGAGDVDVDLFQPSVRLVDLGQVVWSAEPVNGAHGVLEGPAATGSAHRVAGPVQDDQALSTHRLHRRSPRSVDGPICLAGLDCDLTSHTYHAAIVVPDRPACGKLLAWQRPAPGAGAKCEDGSGRREASRRQVRADCHLDL